MMELRKILVYIILTVSVIYGFYGCYIYYQIHRFENRYKKGTDDLRKIQETPAIETTVVQGFQSESTEITPQPSFSDRKDFPFNIVTGHFIIFSYSQKLLDELSFKIEKIYNTIVYDTYLYSYKPTENFSVYIYKNSEEYLSKVKAPQWSSGIARGKSIHLYENKSMDIILAHEISHIILREFMGNEVLQNCGWLNEGLAMYEESKWYPVAKETKFEKHIPFEEFVKINIGSEMDKEKVSQWYFQAQSVVKFLIEERSREQFYNLLSELKEKKDFDSSLAYAYLHQIKNLNELENAWLKYLPDSHGLPKK